MGGIRPTAASVIGIRSAGAGAYLGQEEKSGGAGSKGDAALASVDDLGDEKRDGKADGYRNPNFQGAESEAAPLALWRTQHYCDRKKQHH
jgi:hypothetical protein